LADVALGCKFHESIGVAPDVYFVLVGVIIASARILSTRLARVCVNQWTMIWRGEERNFLGGTSAYRRFLGETTEELLRPRQIRAFDFSPRDSHGMIGDLRLMQLFRLFLAVHGCLMISLGDPVGSFGHLLWLFPVFFLDLIWHHHPQIP
jgi:hypothetical protein